MSFSKIKTISRIKKKEPNKIKYSIHRDILCQKVYKFSGSKARALIYTEKAKKILFSLRKEKLFEKVLSLSKKLDEILKNTAEIKFKNNTYVLTARSHSANSYFSCRKTFMIEFLKGQKGKSFIKDGDLRSYAVFEHLALNYLEMLGLNIIHPVLSYTSVSKNYIVYDFTNLSTLLSLIGKISPEKYKSLIKTVSEIKNALYLDENQLRIKKKVIKKFPFVEDFIIKDINSKNVFYDLKNDKLYFFDLILRVKIDESKLPDKKYISNS